MARFCVPCIWIALVSFAGSSQFDSGEFRQWLRDRKADVHGSLDVGVDESTGLRGLLATKGIPNGTTIFSLPNSSFLTFALVTAEGATWNSCASGKDEKDWLSPVHTAFALFLLEQRTSGSGWQPWISSLPMSDDLWDAGAFPLFYTQDDLAHFQASPVRRVVELDQNAVTNDYSIAKAVWKDLPLEEFRRARMMVKSRVFGLKSLSGNKMEKDIVAMVPFADLMNHPPDDKGQEQNAAPSYDPASGIFSIRTTNDVNAGDGIYWDYGFRSNRASLLRYGFTAQKRVPLTDMPFFFNLTEFPSSSTDASKELKLSRIAEAQKMGNLAMDPDGSVLHELSLSLTGKDAERLLGHMRFLVLQPKDAAGLASYCHTTFCRPISTSNERKALHHLSALLQNLLTTYNSTATEDKEMLDSGHLSFVDGARWHALVVRYGEKRILQGVCNIISAIDPLFDKNSRSLQEEIDKRWNNPRSDIHRYVMENITALVDLDERRQKQAKKKARDSSSKSENA